MNCWAKNGVLNRIVEHLRREQMARIKLEAVSMDSTSVKRHPDGRRGQEGSPNPSVHRWTDHQDSYGCRRCLNGHNVLAPPRRDSQAGVRQSCVPAVAVLDQPKGSSTV